MAKGRDMITFRAILEVLGAPKEHVEKSIALFVDNIKNNENYTVLSEEIHPAEDAEEKDMFVTFAELEMETERLSNIANFCFDFMPSSIEIIEPERLTYLAGDLSNFFNDLQAKLHDLDMTAKQFRVQNSNLKNNSVKLLRNMVLLALRYEGPLSVEKLGERVGIPADQLRPILEKTEKQGYITSSDQGYTIKK